MDITKKFLSLHCKVLSLSLHCKNIFAMHLLMIDYMFILLFSLLKQMCFKACYLYLIQLNTEKIYTEKIINKTPPFNLCLARPDKTMNFSYLARDFLRSCFCLNLQEKGKMWKINYSNLVIIRCNKAQFQVSAISKFCPYIRRTGL